MDEAELIGAARAVTERRSTSWCGAPSSTRSRSRAASPATRRTRATWCRRRTSGPGRASGSSAATRPFSTWMYRITANAAVDPRPAAGAASGPSRSTTTSSPSTRAPRSSPAAARSRPRRSTASRRALDELPPKLRSVVVLKDVYGLSHEAIAEELGISVSAAKVRLHRAPPQAARRVVRRRSRSRMRCDEVTALLPGAGRRRRRSTSRSSATSSRACAARPSWRATAGCCARWRCCGPATSSRRPGLLGDTLAAITDAAEHGARRTLLSGRRLAYAGAIGGSALAAGGHRRVLDRPARRKRGARASPAEPTRLTACGRPTGRCYPRRPGPQGPEGSSSTGRAPVSKTGGWGFESLLPCSHHPNPTRAARVEAT